MSTRENTSNLMYMIRTLGPYVEERRLALGLNQTELAAKCDLPRTTINRIESGITKVPSPDFRRRLAKGLGVSHLDILVASGEIEPEEVQQAGAEGVVDEDAESPKGHIRAIVEGLEWTEEAALQAGDILQIIAKRTR